MTNRVIPRPTGEIPEPAPAYSRCRLSPTGGTVYGLVIRTRTIRHGSADDSNFLANGQFPP
jgi:hypothetical protein